MKHLSIFSLLNSFFVFSLLRKIKQSIYYSIHIFLVIVKAKMVLKQLLSQLNVSGTQNFSCHKLTKTIVINENNIFVFVAFKIMVPSFKGFNNSQELLILHFILGFSQNHLFRKKSHQVQLINFRLNKIYILFQIHQTHVIK